MKKKKYFCYADVKETFEFLNPTLDYIHGVRASDIIILTGEYSLNPSIIRIDPIEDYMYDDSKLAAELRYKEIIELAANEAKPMICFGKAAQLLNFINKGSIIQFTGKTGNSKEIHDKYFKSKYKAPVSTITHALLPTKEQYVLAYSYYDFSELKGVSQSLDIIDNVVKLPEVIYYPDFNSIAINYIPDRQHYEEFEKAIKNYAVNLINNKIYENIIKFNTKKDTTYKNSENRNYLSKC